LIEDKLWEISWKGQFAVMLDIVTPKPGNVHRYYDHHDTRLVHFTASIARLGQPLFLAAQRGEELQRTPDTAVVELGELIRLATQATIAPHGKNTLLGTLLLMIPLAASAGIGVGSSRFTPEKLREGITRLLKESTVEDAVGLVHALQIAKPGGATPKTTKWTSKHESLDYRSPQTIVQLRTEGYTLRSYLELSAPYDAIAQEYATDFAYLFNALYPQFVHSLNRYTTAENATLSTFMWELSQRPDTFIQRKAGPDAAEEVRSQAHSLYTKMTRTPETQWLKLLAPFDKYLHSKGSQLNPGTTADLLSAAIFVALLAENMTLIL
jgi:triphosphoribosyl-dephospho-CoA synthase